MTLRRVSRLFFNCSKMVYWRIGFITRTNAGRTPAKRAAGPSSRRSASSVPIVDGALFGLSPPDRAGSVTSALRAVIRVLTTQIGLVIRTVALPARAPAIIDSMVVSLFEARPALRAARSKPARVHSYPISRRSANHLRCSTCHIPPGANGYTNSSNTRSW